MQGDHIRRAQRKTVGKNFYIYISYVCASFYMLVSESVEKHFQKLI